MYFTTHKAAYDIGKPLGHVLDWMRAAGQRLHCTSLPSSQRNKNLGLLIGNRFALALTATTHAASCCASPTGTATICHMPKSPRYTSEHAAAGLDAKFPEIETWPNQFPGYEIVVDDPEFTSVCPKTGLPDFGIITIRYMPGQRCLELKSLKEYLQSYRNLGIFQENVVNQVLEDVVKWAKPVWAEVKGEFRPRGGISTTIVARWPRKT